MIAVPPPDPELAGLPPQGLTVEVPASQDPTRLDRFLSQQTGLGRGQVRRLIDFGSAWVNGRVCRVQSRMLVPLDRVALYAPFYGTVRFYEIDPARILYRDRWLLAYDKEAGIPSQPVPYDAHNNLYAALVRHLGPGGYAGLHHRLDRLASGVMLFSLDRAVNASLGKKFGEGDLEKIYLAVVAGRPAAQTWTEDRPVAKRKGSYFLPPDRQGKPSRTDFEVLARGRDRSLVKARPITGRTHQIRLHLQAAGHPILGDEEHQGPPAERLMLHAARLSLKHPRTGAPLRIEAPSPAGFEIQEEWGNPF
jgi:23S rRNA pseudouridine1911/1915/1917 synthase